MNNDLPSSQNDSNFETGNSSTEQLNNNESAQIDSDSQPVFEDSQYQNQPPNDSTSSTDELNGNNAETHTYKFTSRLPNKHS